MSTDTATEPTGSSANDAAAEPSRLSVNDAAAELSILSVNETIRKYPATVAVFNHHGIDACCGGAAPIAAAATRDGADAGTVMADLMQLLREAE